MNNPVYHLCQFVKRVSFQPLFMTIQQIVHYVKNTIILYNYWYFFMATCLSFDSLQANLHR